LGIQTSFIPIIHQVASLLPENTSLLRFTDTNYIGVTSPHFSPGFGISGQAGVAAWPIGRRGIAIAMAQE
jgi:hypothetical protein